MTLREASVALKVKVRTLRWWITTGKIRAEKIKQKWMIPDDEIARFKESEYDYKD